MNSKLPTCFLLYNSGQKKLKRRDPEIYIFLDRVAYNGF